jgi:hypothetical protein
MSRITHLCLPVSNLSSLNYVFCHHYNLNLSPTSHELGDALLLQRQSTLFLQEYNSGLLIVVCAPTNAVVVGVFVATLAVRGSSAAPAALLLPLML